MSNPREESRPEPTMTRRIFCFWTGSTAMSTDRSRCLTDLIHNTGCQVILVTPHNLTDYILPEHPLHEAYQFLSETHKSDYLRTYFMHFYGGGYSDVKSPTDDWNSAFDDLESHPSKLANGYREFSAGCIAAPSVEQHWQRLIGNGAYIFRPQTAFTHAWYTQMMNLLDSKLEALKLHPASHPRDREEDGQGYPIQWNEMLGRIFHLIAFEYVDFLLYTVPIPVLYNYR